ncbi:hypothetical protein P7C70_g2644, partial [Phenoliferia sp. Uapishka_3]
MPNDTFNLGDPTPVANSDIGINDLPPGSSDLEELMSILNMNMRQSEVDLPMAGSFPFPWEPAPPVSSAPSDLVVVSASILDRHRAIINADVTACKFLYPSIGLERFLYSSPGAVVVGGSASSFGSPQSSQQAESWKATTSLLPPSPTPSTSYLEAHFPNLEVASPRTKPGRGLRLYEKEQPSVVEVLMACGGRPDTSTPAAKPFPGVTGLHYTFVSTNQLGSWGYWLCNHCIHGSDHSKRGNGEYWVQRTKPSTASKRAGEHLRDVHKIVLGS